MGSYGDGDATAEQEHKAVTRAFSIGSFCLEGELWQICVRELLKSRMNRLSRVLETSIQDSEDRISRCSESCRAGYSTRSSLETALRSMTADAHSKIEFLFGMMELWET
ncbi:hypothetical protein LZ30DRAFT_735938 [Colletotrichum cereale]|nr:hypothetical protein LZ30DRAFT_735938 [Colletotrichum cereale]